MDSSSRRSFLKKTALGTLCTSALSADPASAMPWSDVEGWKRSAEQGPAWNGVTRCVTERAFQSRKPYADPFNQVELDVVFRDPEGQEQRVPAFWAGENLWRVRYAPHSAGRYRYRTVCSDPKNLDLHGQNGFLEVSAYQGDNPLLKHGPVRVADDHLHFRHEDGTPFFWLGDTWWMGLCKRLRWPEDFQTLTEDRVRKGFSVIQIVAGLYPDMPPFDPRGENEAGYAWEAGYARINPRYFDMADLRIQYLVDQGLVPCIVGCWGFFLIFMGQFKAKKHWRNIIARWGAYPVIWCLAGEGTMPYYRSENRREDSEKQRSGWTDVGRYVRSTDPFHHLITIHPSSSARDTLDDPSVLDIDMLQTGHEDVWSIPNTINVVTRELVREPRMPVLVGEVTYEGHKQQNRQQVVRFMFWSCILSGAGGHTYGAGGIWEVQTRAHPYGASPWGGGYGDLPWDVAYQYPGSQQLGAAKELLTRYEWWRLEAHPEWVEPHWSPHIYIGNQDDEPKETYLLPYAAGIPGELRVVFIPLNMWQLPKIVKLESNIPYEGFWFDPATGKEYPIGTVAPDSDGSYQLQRAKHIDLVDWVFVLENRDKIGKTSYKQNSANGVDEISCRALRAQNLVGW
jgi:hypothetical protein